VGAAAASDVLATVDTSSSDLPGFAGAVDRSGAGGYAASASETALFDAATDAVLSATLSGPLVSMRAQERTAAAVWLLTLVHGLGAYSSVLQRRLREVHSAFMRLLGERSAFTQVRLEQGVAR
jgi:hypothetical protein